MSQQASDDMAAAERSIQQVMAVFSPGEAMSALLKLYDCTPEKQKTALVASLAVRVALASRPGRVMRPAVEALRE